MENGVQYATICFFYPHLMSFLPTSSNSRADILRRIRNILDLGITKVFPNSHEMLRAKVIQTQFVSSSI